LHRDGFAVRRHINQGLRKAQCQHVWNELSGVLFGQGFKKLPPIRSRLVRNPLYARGTSSRDIYTVPIIPSSRSSGGWLSPYRWA
jgi:hypothetical protein